MTPLSPIPAEPVLDAAANRKARKYSPREMVLRVLWGAAEPLFRFSPRIFWGWRNMILRCFGARIGRNVQINPRARIFFAWNLDVGDESAIAEDALLYNLGRITLGRQVTVSHGAQLCAGSHDFRRRDLPLLRPPVVVEDCAWICTQAFVGPGVKVGAGAVVGARAVVTRDVAPWVVMAGNPAQQVGTRELTREGGA